MDMTNTRLGFVDTHAFQSCTSLREVVFPYGFHSFTVGTTTMELDWGAFDNCTSLVKVVFPSTVVTCNNIFLFYHAHQFNNCHPSMTIYGYAGSVVQTMCTKANFTFSALDLEQEDRNRNYTPAAIPTLPTAPSSTVTTSPSTSTLPSYQAWATGFIDFVAPVIMPDISVTNYNDSSSRGTIAQSLYNMCGNGANVSASHSFGDVGSFGTAIAWCHANGVMNGTSGTEFGTDSNVTREQFALILICLDLAMWTVFLLGRRTVWLGLLPMA